jgi:hypothetical protein
MEFRGTITVKRAAPISNDEYSRVLAALNQRHEELGAVGGGGDRNTAVFVLSTDEYLFPAPAAAELVDAVVDALKYADLEDAWPVSLDLEEVEEDSEEPPAPQVAHG